MFFLLIRTHTYISRYRLPLARFFPGLTIFFSLSVYIAVLQYLEIPHPAKFGKLESGGAWLLCSLYWDLRGDMEAKDPVELARQYV